uniref:Signal transducer and transcription activator (inferred by orthology to a D. melanogaster protein) n=1 Tax=Anisakis simplex TaxID=6269 RepID=A0A0M3KAQ6_ANISI
LSPFSIKELDQLSLAQRIASCPQLKEIRYLYPDIDKEEMLRYFESEDRQKSSSPTGVSDSPSSISNQSRLDWSPSEVIPRANSMDIGEELVTMLSQNIVENNVESLLGPGFHPQLPSQPLQQIDLSFIDGASNPFHFTSNDTDE